MSRFAGRYVFVAGLHRSGTSLVASILGSHPQVAEIRGAPIPEQEGVYLQGAIPHTARHGIPGEFAFDNTQHMTEGHVLDRLETRTRMEADWTPWFTSGGSWRVEKSPVNLFRMRLYQQLFPLAHFLIVVRHPEAVARSTAKWSTKSLSELVRHWEQAYEIALADMPYLHHAAIVRYEDLCRRPRETVDGMFAFLSLETTALDALLKIRNRNPARLSAFPDTSIAGRLGYSALQRLGARPALWEVRHSLASVRDTATRTLFCG